MILKLNFKKWVHQVYTRLIEDSSILLALVLIGAAFARTLEGGIIAVLFAAVLLLRMFKKTASLKVVHTLYHTAVAYVVLSVLLAAEAYWLEYLAMLSTVPYNGTAYDLTKYPLVPNAASLWYGPPALALYIVVFLLCFPNLTVRISAIANKFILALVSTVVLPVYADQTDFLLLSVVCSCGLLAVRSTQWLVYAFGIAVYVFITVLTVFVSFLFCANFLCSPPEETILSIWGFVKQFTRQHTIAAWFLIGFLLLTNKQDGKNSC